VNDWATDVTDYGENWLIIPLGIAGFFVWGTVTYAGCIGLPWVLDACMHEWRREHAQKADRKRLALLEY
jgi:hypothetical protein